MKQQNKQQKKKVHSIRGQFAWIFIGLMIGTILLCLLLNYMFLGRVYMQSKLDVIHDAYETIKQAAESDSYGSEEFAHELDDVCRSYNMTVCVMDVNSNMKYVSINGGERLENRLIGYVFGFGTFPDNERVIENGDDYVIQRTGQENKEYLEIYGRLISAYKFSAFSLTPYDLRPVRCVPGLLHLPESSYLSESRSCRTAFLCR